VHLLARIAPAALRVTTAALGVADPAVRAARVLADAERMGVRKFVRVVDITGGHAKLNLAFVAHLFNTFPALDGAGGAAVSPTSPTFPTSPGRGSSISSSSADLAETREETTTRLWMNSLGVSPLVTSLRGDDLKDGLIFLQLLEMVRPGCVEAKRVNRGPFAFGGGLKKIANLNYALTVGRALGFTLVGIAGSDLHEGSRSAALAFAWQLMRASTLNLVASLAPPGGFASNGYGGADVESTIVSFVNDCLRGSGAPAGSLLHSLRDARIGTALPVLDFVSAIKPGAVPATLVLRNPTSDADRLANAKLALSAARKVGARIYALPEDLVETNPKMVLTVFAALMARALQKAATGK
jgi:hypothetical protein